MKRLRPIRMNNLDFPPSINSMSGFTLQQVNPTIDSSSVIPIAYRIMADRIDPLMIFGLERLPVRLEHTVQCYLNKS